MIQRFKRNSSRFAQSGNAILVSLVLMALALTTTLSLAAIVSGETRNVSLVPQSERAYYKSESYVEQALWEKKQDQTFSLIPPASPIDTFICETEPTTPCFSTAPQHPNGPNGFLKRFSATTQLLDTTFRISQDQTVQIDIDSSSAGPTGTLAIDAVKGVTDSTNTNQLKGVEVTIIAFPRDLATATSYSGAAGPTPIFIDKKFVAPKDTGAFSLLLGNNPGSTANKAQNTGEAYPSLGTANYRIRIKALGGDANISRPSLPACSGQTGNLCKLLAVDYTVQAVAEDGQARRGVQVLVPAAAQASNIFDFVLFSDIKLGKIKEEGKKPASLLERTITGQLYRLPNYDPRVQPQPACPPAGVNPTTVGATPRNGERLNLSDGTNNTVQTAGPTPPGETTFTNLAQTVVYVLTMQTVPNSYNLCPPTSHTSSPTGSPNQADIYRLTLQPICTTGTGVGPPYPHYGPPYDHYTAPYPHYQWVYQPPWDEHHGPSGVSQDHAAGKSHSAYVLFWGEPVWPYFEITWPAGWHQVWHHHEGFWYQQYIGTYPDYLGYYGDYLGTYGDPYTFFTCPS